MFAKYFVADIHEQQLREILAPLEVSKRSTRRREAHAVRMVKGTLQETGDNIFFAATAKTSAILKFASYSSIVEFR